MTIEQEAAEIWRNNRPKIKWELERSRDKEFIFEEAKRMGWLETPQKVQVRLSIEGNFKNESVEWFSIEPYEDDCNCSDIIAPPMLET